MRIPHPFIHSGLIEHPPCGRFWAMSSCRYHRDNEMGELVHISSDLRVYQDRSRQWQCSEGWVTREQSREAPNPLGERKGGAMECFSKEAISNLNSKGTHKKGTHKKCYWSPSHISLALYFSLQDQLPTANCQLLQLWGQGLLLSTI